MKKHSQNFQMFAKKTLPILVSINNSGTKIYSENLEYGNLLSFIEPILGINSFQKIDSLLHFEKIMKETEFYFVNNLYIFKILEIIIQNL